MILTVALVFCVASCLADPATTQGNVTVLGDLTVVGSLIATSIRSQSLIVDGSISVARGVSCEGITTGKVDATVLETTQIASPTGVVHISGQLSTSGISTNTSISAFAFIQNDVRQWAVAHHDDFEGKVEGWSTKETSSCDGADTHLAGHCKNVNGEVTKTYTGLPEHTHIRVQARYHFLDSWEGETAFAKIDNKIVWTDTNDVRGLNPDTKSICGGEHADSKFSVPVDVTTRHSADSITISFGATLDEHPCDESFGIDDVIVSFR
jgi:hypothetical protein